MRSSRPSPARTRQASSHSGRVAFLRRHTCPEEEELTVHQELQRSLDRTTRQELPAVSKWYFRQRNVPPILSHCIYRSFLPTVDAYNAYVHMHRFNYVNVHTLPISSDCGPGDGRGTSPARVWHEPRQSEDHLHLANQGSGVCLHQIARFHNQPGALE